MDLTPSDGRRRKYAFVKREKMYPQHADAYQYYPDKVARASQLQAVIDMRIPVIEETFKGGYWTTGKIKHPYRLLKAQFNDQVCVLALLEALLDSQPGIYIRPEYLVPQLTRLFPQYFWPQGTIGRMMAGLRAVCALEYSEVPEHQLPFDKGRDARGKYYVIDPMGGDEGFLWLLRLRAIVHQKVQDMMQRQCLGDFDTDTAPFTQPQVLYYEWFEGTRIRDAETYVAQQRPGLPPVRQHVERLVTFERE